jgi:hypothetical protein
LRLRNLSASLRNLSPSLKEANGHPGRHAKQAFSDSHWRIPPRRPADPSAVGRFMLPVY